MGTSVARRSAPWIVVGLFVALLTGASAPPPAAAATTFVVDNTSDDAALNACTVAPDDCSLRGAIATANTTPGTDAIHFLIPAAQCPGGICPITLTKGPITITEALTIDGSTQVQNAGPSANVCATASDPSHMRIEVLTDPSGSDASALIIDHATGESTIRGLALGTNSATGISFGIQAAAGSGHHIECNHLGADAAGTAQLGTGAFYAAIATGGVADHIVIGTDGDGVDDIAERNVIAADGYGIYINANDYNKISGNYFGMTADGTTPLSYGSVFLRQSSSKNLIGVDVDGVSDDVEVNYFVGTNAIIMTVDGYATSANQVIGNVFGMTANGTVSPINRAIAITSLSSDDVEYAIRDNTILAATTDAIYIDGSGGTVVIDGNWIGGTADGTFAGNDVGISLEGYVSARVTDNLITSSGTYGLVLYDFAKLAGGSTGNCLVANADGAANITTSTVTFENNWWGAIDGPSGNGPGTGDSVSFDIDYDPWAVNPGPLCNLPPIAVDADYSVAEDAAIGQIVGEAPALDDGLDLTFSIVAGDPGGKFTIDPATGYISTAAALDYETTSSYTLTFEVDDGTYTDQATIDIAVTNVAPVVTDDSFGLREDEAVGGQLGFVTASDPGATLQYSITAGNTGGAFAIDSATGEITTAAALDYLTTPSYTLTVSVSDGLLAGTGTITVTIADIPRFEDVPMSHTFYGDIEWLAWQGVTKGCNPPHNTLYCPDASVTRGQMAAFLHRALGDTLTPGAAVSFTDTATSVFAADIEWLGSVGVTKGCNPPVNDMFCPNDVVTRAQMAAFLVRAMGYTAGAGSDRFTDDDGSIFEADIERLAEAGVTLGCNPPVNDHFCPNAPVTRAQMAAFLHRALGP